MFPPYHDRQPETYGVRREFRCYARLPAENGIDALRGGLRDNISVVLLPGNGTAKHSFVRMEGVIGDFENIRAAVRRLGGVLLPTAPKL